MVTNDSTRLERMELAIQEGFARRESPTDIRLNNEKIKQEREDIVRIVERVRDQQITFRSLPPDETGGHVEADMTIEVKMTDTKDVVETIKGSC